MLWKQFLKENIYWSTFLQNRLFKTIIGKKTFPNSNSFCWQLKSFLRKQHLLKTNEKVYSFFLKVKSCKGFFLTEFFMTLKWIQSKKLIWLFVMFCAKGLSSRSRRSSSFAGLRNQLKTLNRPMHWCLIVISNDDFERLCFLAFNDFWQIWLD